MPVRATNFRQRLAFTGLVAFAGLCSTASFAAERYVSALDDYALNGAESLDLVVYEPDGTKLDTLEAVTSTEVAGLPVLEESGGRLIALELRGARVWVRADRLAMTRDSMPPCPKSLPGAERSRVIAGVSGAGPACRRDDGS